LFYYFFSFSWLAREREERENREEHLWSKGKWAKAHMAVLTHTLYVAPMAVTRRYSLGTHSHSLGLCVSHP
jgi:hypothetical protein